MPPRSSKNLCHKGLIRSSTRPYPDLLSRIAVASPRSVRLVPLPILSSVHWTRRSSSHSPPNFTATPPIMAQIERITENLEKPELDDRSYRVIRLPNKLEALLVHDPDTDKASAAVNVNVGNFSDEDDMPGMAHAVEHLLFMGTKKVNEESPVFPAEVNTNRDLYYLVSEGKCIQPVPSVPLWFVKCLHSRHRNELLL